MQKDSTRLSEKLTKRQEEVLRLLLRGLGEKDIAVDLGISRHTVHNHVKAIYTTLEVKSRYELFLRYADTAGAAGDCEPGGATVESGGCSR